MPGPSVDEVRQYQRELTDYFKFWRRGERHMHHLQLRKDAIANIKFPAKGRWPGFDRKHAPARHRPMRINNAWAEGGPDVLKNNAIAANSRLISRMKVAGFAFKKILGWGGLGVASLFEAIDGTDPTKRALVVCKLDLYNDHPCVVHEIGMHMVSLSS